MENNRFETADITLAAFLKVKEITLVEVIPITNYQCKFVFEKPPQELLDTWLGGLALADVRQTINSYRHLVRESRAKQGVR